MLSIRYASEAKILPEKLGDHLPGSSTLDFKARSKLRTVHLQAQLEELQEEFGELCPFADWRALRDFYQI